MPKSVTPLGVRLVEAYKGKGVTSKKEISEKLGFQSENAIYKVLSGDRELSFDSLRRFAQTTGQSIHWLLTGEEESQGVPDFQIDAEGMARRLKTVFPNMTESQIAERLNISHDKLLGSFGGRIPATEVLVKIAEQTGVSLAWLLTDRGPQWTSGGVEQPREELRVSEDDGFLPRTGAVRPNPEQIGSSEKVLLAHMELIIQQNNRTIEQNNQIIQLLEAIAQKT